MQLEHTARDQRLRLVRRDLEQRALAQSQPPEAEHVRATVARHPHVHQVVAWRVRVLGGTLCCVVRVVQAQRRGIRHWWHMIWLCRCVMKCQALLLTVLVVSLKTLLRLRSPQLDTVFAQDTPDPPHEALALTSVRSSPMPWYLLMYLVSSWSYAR